jgi:hypothetical protein
MYALAWLAVLLVSGFVAMKSSKETGKVVLFILALPLIVWGAVKGHKNPKIGRGGRGGSSNCSGGSCGGGCGGCGGGD